MVVQDQIIPVLSGLLQNSALTLGGSVFRKLGLAFLLLSIPAEARFKLAGSEIVVRFHLSAERPPFRITRLDIPMIPRLGFPYLQENEKYKPNAVFKTVT